MSYHVLRAKQNKTKQTNQNEPNKGMSMSVPRQVNKIFNVNAT